MIGTETRSRTVQWENPLAAAALLPTMDGLDFLKGIGSGEIPQAPILRLLGVEPVRVDRGVAVFSVEPAEYHYNPLGIAHGGLLSTLCDTALGCAIHSLLPAGRGYTTLELKVNYTRPATARSGRLECEGRVLHLGTRSATAEARVVDADGRMYAHATTTCLLLDLNGASG
jgi:uncharacterized protein (TIGR00369 family)